MNLSQYLEQQGIDEHNLRSEVVNFVQPKDGEFVFACGSLAEGLGNHTSDIDICYAYLDGEGLSNNGAGAEVRIGPIICDIYSVSLAEMRGLIDLVNTLSAPDINLSLAAKSISDFNRRLVHRLAHSFTLFGESTHVTFRELLEEGSLLYHKFNVANYYANVLRLDMAGLRDESEWKSLAMVGQDLLGHTFDALLAGYGYSNPTPKWRTKLLRNIPNNWNHTLLGEPIGEAALDRFFRLHCIPEGFTSQTAYEFALEVASFSRLIFPMIESRLLNEDFEREDMKSIHHKRPEVRRTTPHLDLDIAIKYRDRGFEIFRINSNENRFHLSNDLFELIRFFNDKTWVENTDLHIVADSSSESEFDGLFNLFSKSDFFAKEMIDEDLLRELLSS